MELKKVLEQLRSICPCIENHEYDGLIIKKLAATNTISDTGSSHQSHIAITGAQMDIFPFLRADGYFEKEFSSKDDDLKKYFVLQIPVTLYKENVEFLCKEKSSIVDFGNSLQKETFATVLRSRRNGAADQVELSIKSLDGSDFIEFRKMLRENDFFVLLKKKGFLSYDLVGIPQSVGVATGIEELNGFYREKNITAVPTSNFKINEDYFDRNIKEIEVDVTQNRDTAKSIMDFIYQLDSFARINDFFFEGDENTVKFDDNVIKMTGVFYLEGNARFVTGEGKRRRAFGETDYSIKKINRVGHLTTEWYNGSDKTNVPDIRTLLDIVKKYYSDVVLVLENNNVVRLVTDSLNKSKTIVEKFSKLLGEFSRCDAWTERYIRSLSTKPFVILSGNSGTGKTRIARNFAQWLKVDGLENVLLLPVGADWTDNTKIFGYYNPLANDGVGEYIKTNVLKLIERANAHPDVPFFLILDEMNLSHVERYFSDFLSLMETPEESIKLNSYGSELKFPKNLFVTGTVNIDETTYMFSPKVLDRANVIEFKPEMDDVLASLKQSSRVGGVVPADPGYAEAFMKLANDVREDRIHDELKLDNIKVHLDALYPILQDAGFEFAYRTVKEIRLYAIASYELCEDKSKYDVNQVADEQIVQKILPKIHGNKKQIGGMLETLQQYCTDQKFELSGKKIAEMQKRLERFQYASFV